MSDIQVLSAELLESFYYCWACLGVCLLELLQVCSDVVKLQYRDYFPSDVKLSSSDFIVYVGHHFLGVQSLVFLFIQVISCIDRIQAVWYLTA